MPPVSLGLVGCGRIGRSLVRLLAGRDDLRLAAIEEPAEPKAIEYLLRFDTLLGRFPLPIARRDRELEIAGHRIRLLAPAEGAVPAWGELGVSVVIEASGRERSRVDLERHFTAGAERVLLCAPSTEPPDLTYVAGVTEGKLAAAHRIVSVGSVTANCIGPVVRVMAREFGLERAFVASVHAFSSQLRLADVPTPDMRSGRAAAENIIPQPTNADEVLAELMPELAGKTYGLALHVPVANGSVVDLTCWHPRAVTADEINAAMRRACAGELAGVIAFEDQPIVSSDILGTPFSGVFDSLSTMVVAGRVSKGLVFYDNASGYVHRVAELAGRLGALPAPGAGS